MTLRLRPPRGRRLRLPALACAVSLSLAAAASASAATVTSGHLDWSNANVYESGAPAGTNRTWLGYVTGPTPLAAGTATPSGGAGGDTVTTASARGATQLFGFSFPATGGTYDAATNAGTVELRGMLTFASAAHGFTITVVDPQLVLSGTTGKLFASGQGSTSQGPKAYDRTSALFDLDLGAAAVTDFPDGSRAIAGIVPRIATADYAFPPNYAAGAGPDRTPNTFGSFAVTLALAPAGTTTPGGGTPQPGAGSSRPTPTTVARLTGKVHGGTTARKRTVTITLARALSANAAKTYRVRLTASGRTFATGELHGRQLKLNVRKGKLGYHRLKGTFTLRPSSKKAKLAPTRLKLS